MKYNENKSGWLHVDVGQFRLSVLLDDFVNSTYIAGSLIFFKRGGMRAKHNKAKIRIKFMKCFFFFDCDIDFIPYGFVFSASLHLASFSHMMKSNEWTQTDRPNPTENTRKKMPRTQRVGLEPSYLLFDSVVVWVCIYDEVYHEFGCCAQISMTYLSLIISDFNSNFQERKNHEGQGLYKSQPPNLNKLDLIDWLTGPSCSWAL